MCAPPTLPTYIAGFSAPNNPLPTTPTPPHTPYPPPITNPPKHPLHPPHTFPPHFPPHTSKVLGGSCDICPTSTTPGVGNCISGGRGRELPNAPTICRRQSHFEGVLFRLSLHPLLPPPCCKPHQSLAPSFRMVGGAMMPRPSHGRCWPTGLWQSRGLTPSTRSTPRPLVATRLSPLLCDWRRMFRSRSGRSDQCQQFGAHFSRQTTAK